MYTYVCRHTLTQHSQVCNSHRLSQKLILQVLMAWCVTVVHLSPTNQKAILEKKSNWSPNPFYLILMIYDWIQVNATFLNTCSITGIKKPTSNFTKTERHETAVLLQWNLQTEKWGQFHLILQRTKPNVFMITRITNGRDTILKPNTQMKTSSSLQFTTAKSLLLFGVRRAFSQTLCLWDSSEVPKERQQRPSFVKSAARLFQRNKCKGTHKGSL